MKLSIIVAMARNRVIGCRGQLPWRLSADLQRFKRITMGHPLLMGRKTFESIGRPLPGRTSIVITRQPGFTAEGIITADSFTEAVRVAAKCAAEAFVIGGGEIYAQALPHASRLYVTAVDTDSAGDVYFPDWNPRDWQLVEESSHAADAKNSFAMQFQVFDRISS